MKGLIKFASAAFIALTLTSCGGGGGGGALDPAGGAIDNPQTNPPVANNAYEEMQTRPELARAVEGLAGSGVLHQLSGAGDYTFFAPNNQAFLDWADARQQTIEELMADNNELYRVLKYHITLKRFAAGDLPLGLPVETVRGDIMKPVNEAGQIGLYDGVGSKANVVGTDIVKSNATIHVIDRVIFPTQNTAASLLRAKPEISLFADLVEQEAGVDLLADESRTFTVLAPTNDAMNALYAQLGVTHEAFLAAAVGTPAYDARIRASNYHLSFVSYFVQEMLQLPGSEVTSLGGKFTVSAQTRQITDITGQTINITQADGIVKNGVVHVLDKVMLSAPLQ
jgi:uncharacterized surface protein with fasciclin (FAS1) repeats